MRIFLILPALLFTVVSKGQLNTFNQYNGALSSINPAYIANIDKNNFSLILRNQWPGYRTGSLLGEASFNKHFNKINSSIGFSSNYQDYHQGGYEAFNHSVIYAYKIYFLNKFILNFGLQATYQDISIDPNNFYYKIEPGREYTETLSSYSGTRNITSGYGFMIQNVRETYYIGFSYRNHQLSSQNDESLLSAVYRKPTLSLQLMKRLNLNRRTMLFTYAGLEKVGALGHDSDSGFTDIQSGYSCLHLQANLFFKKSFIIGVGYKAFEGSYGTANYRFAVLPDYKKNLTIGYSYDVIPFAVNNELHFAPSHEIYIKRKLFTKKK